MSPAVPGEPGELHRSLVLLLADAGFEPAELPGLRFADVDSFLAAELVLLVEERLGRPVASEAFALDMPVTDLLALVDDHRRTPSG